ncbi:MAG: hypothetical protein ACFNKE_07910, partial [Neisseria elongata]
MLLGNRTRSLVNDDVEDRSHQGERLLQRDDPGQGCWGYGGDLRGYQRGYYAREWYWLFRAAHSDGERAQVAANAVMMAHKL